MITASLLLIAAAPASAATPASNIPAAVNAADPVVPLRAIVTPALACERQFDAERRQLADERRKIDAMPSWSAAEQAQWHAAWQVHDGKDREFKERRGKVCKTEESFERLKAHLARMRPDLSPGEVHLFALGFFHDLRRTAEYAADFATGYNARQYSPPPPPPTSSRSNPGT